MKYFNLFVGILGLFNVVNTFIYPSNNYTFIGVEINVWLYRLIWLGLAASCLYNFNKYRKATKK